MATTVTLRKILDRKQWELLPPVTALTMSVAASVAPSTLFDQYQFWMSGASNLCLYDPREDAWMALPNSGMTTFGSSGHICYHPNGPTGTASAGSATTITTVTTLPGSLAGYTIRITAGTGAGQERTIASNTYGANSVITVTSNWSTNPDNTSVYLLITGRVWALNGSTTAGLRYYDVATNTWSAALSVTGVTAATADWRITATPSYGNPIATGTATAGAASTLTNSAKAWATNQWANYQVRITAGTGVGQVRTVASNTGTVLTVSANWSTNPDATSVYVIEGNDDYLYLAGGGAVALYRYSISGNTWSTLSPGNARTAAPGNTGTLIWVGTASDAAWADETNIKNGRYLIAFQGGNSTNLSYYDIAANTWINLTNTYLRGGGGDFVPNNDTVTFGYHFAVDREFIYIVQARTSPPAGCWRYNCVTQTMDPWATWTFPTPNSVLGGNRASVVSYADGGTTLRWVYVQPGGGNAFASPQLRMMII